MAPRSDPEEPARRRGAAGVLDARVLGELAELAGADPAAFLRDLFRMFREDAARRMGELEVGCAGGDFGAVAGAAHALKSSSAQLGAVGLAELCEGIETLARCDADPNALERLVQSARETLARVERAMGEFETSV